jgi:hypothetical protein
VNALFFDSPVQDVERRRLLYDGQLFVYSATPSSRALCEFAQQLSEEAFAPFGPTKAQFEMPPEKYAAVLEVLKPKFIHHPTSKQLIKGVLQELGCDLAKTYFDVPRLRTATSDNYMTSGLAYAFHPHRDTWYSAPSCQINWWIPVYDVERENTMAFHPRYWNQPVRNGSRDYNYAVWNRESRKDAVKHVKTDTRKQPKAEEDIDPDPQIRFVAPAGSILLFSGAQMHSTIPNTSGRTRFSIDFRTVHLDDVVGHRGAPNIDSECTGTTMRDYLRGTDLAHIREDICLEYDTQPSNV